MNLAVLLLAVVTLAIGAALIVGGRRRRLNRAATTGQARTSALEILGIALTVGSLPSLSHAF